MVTGGKKGRCGKEIHLFGFETVQFNSRCLVDTEMEIVEYINLEFRRGLSCKYDFGNHEHIGGI